MRLAVYFSGRIKSYEDCMYNLLQLHNTHEVTFFCALNVGTIGEYEEKFIRMCDMGTDQYTYEAIITPKWVLDLDLRGTGCNKHNVYSHFLNNKKCTNMIEKYEATHGVKFDCVMKCRADVISSEPIPIPAVIEPGKLYIPNTHVYSGGMNDQISCGTLDVMKIYGRVVDDLDLLCNVREVPYHPETLLFNQMKFNGIEVVQFDFLYWLHPGRFDTLHDGMEADLRFPCNDC